MVRKKLAVAIAAIGALHANVASALGMGDFTLNSALNQPLDAEIRLLNTDDLDKSQLIIKMADPKDFENAGVSRDFFLSSLRFDVKLDGAGGGVIKVTSREPVIEPYLNFLIETRWPTGRMLREYTVLLDLPVFSETQAQAVEQVSSSASEPARSNNTRQVRPKVSSRAATQAPQRQVRSESKLTPGEDYRVKTEDTLWQIALDVRPDGASVQQTMVGIQRINPSAFVNGNINRLKAGSVLRLPGANDISVSNKDAIGEVANHNRAWRDGDDLTSDARPQLDATATAEDSGNAPTSEPRLSIATGGDDDRSAAGDGDGDGDGTVALRNELVEAQETLDKTARENDELQSRIGDMEAKVATLQRLLTLKDDQLAAMQSGAEAGIDQSSGDTADGALGETSEEATAANLDQEDTQETAADAAKEEPKPKAKPKPAPKEESLIDQLLANPLYLGGAGIALLALILVLWRRRSSADDEMENDDSFESQDFSAVVPNELSLEEEQDDSSEEPAQDEDDSTSDLVAELEAQISADNGNETTTSDVDGSDLDSPILDDSDLEINDAESEIQPAAVESETGDAIAEADIYIAYGRYQQAIDLLRGAMDAEPSRTDLQVKLLEVYIETRDKPSFQQGFSTLQQCGDEDAIHQVKEMLSSVDGVSDWLDDLPEAEVTDLAETTDSDMDLDLLEGEAAEQESDESLSFDLEDDISEQTVLDEDLSDDLADELDLDLDLDNISLDATQENDTVSLDGLGGEAEGELSVDSDEDSFELSDELSSLADSEADSVEADASDEGFELDLEDDLDMEALGDSDLNDLAAEFGEQDAGQDAPEADDELSLVLDDDGDDFELDAMDSPEPSAEKLDEELGLGGEVKFDSGLELEATETEAGAESSDDDGFILAEDLDDDFEIDSDELDLDSLELGSLDLNDDSELSLSEDDGGSEVGEVNTEEVADLNAAAEAGDDDEFDFLADTDEVATKLDLARAYIDMGDTEGARDILDEVRQEGSDEQKQEADALIERLE